MFDGKLMSASLQIFITCLYSDLRAYLPNGTCISVLRGPIRDNRQNILKKYMRPEFPWHEVKQLSFWNVAVGTVFNYFH
jgi:hypothetical protein